MSVFDIELFLIYFGLISLTVDSDASFWRLDKSSRGEGRLHFKSLGTNFVKGRELATLWRLILHDVSRYVLDVGVSDHVEDSHR